MDIFRRKRLEKAEAENEWLKEDCLKLQADLQRAQNEAATYKRELDEARSRIRRLISQNEQIVTSKSNANYWNEKDKENLKLEIEELKKKLAKADEKNAELNSILERENGEIEGSKTNSVNPIWNIQDEVRNNPAYVREVYRNKSVFFTPNEAKFYELLLPLVQNKGLFLFSKVRLVDIVGLSSEFYDENAKEKAIEKNPKEDETVFLNNPYKKDVIECIKKNKSDFNHSDYKRIFLFPLFRLHIDFLVCKKADGKFKPILALELNGEEHDIESQNDGFKKTLFYSNKRNQIGFLKIKNKTLGNSSELKKTFEGILNDVVNDTAKDKWKEFQKNLDYLAE